MCLPVSVRARGVNSQWRVRRRRGVGLTPPGPGVPLPDTTVETRGPLRPCLSVGTSGKDWAVFDEFWKCYEVYVTLGLVRSDDIPMERAWRQYWKQQHAVPIGSTDVESIAILTTCIL